MMLGLQIRRTEVRSFVFGSSFLLSVEAKILRDVIPFRAMKTCGGSVSTSPLIRNMRTAWSWSALCCARFTSCKERR